VTQHALLDRLILSFTEPDSNRVHLLEYSTILGDLYFTRVSFLGSTRDFTQVHLIGKCCTLYSTTFLFITPLSTLYYFKKKEKENGKSKIQKPSICCFPLKRDRIVHVPLIGTAYQQSPSAFRQSQLHGQI